MRKRQHSRNILHVVFICVLSFILLGGSVAYLLVQKKGPNIDALRIPLQSDNDGILLATCAVGNVPKEQTVQCCFDTASSYVVIASKDCGSCKTGAIRLKCGDDNSATEELTYGTQSDLIQWCTEDLKVIGSYKNLLVKNSHIALSQKRSGSSNYNILGFGRSTLDKKSFVSQASIHSFTLNIEDQYVEINPKMEAGSFHMVSLSNFQPNYYSVLCNQVLFGTKEVGNRVQMIFDTGTNMMHLPSAIFQKFKELHSVHHSVLHILIGNDVKLSYHPRTYSHMGQLLIEESSEDYIILGSLFMNFVMHLSATEFGIMR